MKPKKKKLRMKVFTNQSNGQKLVTIPKNSGIEDGDFVEIKKLKVGE